MADPTSPRSTSEKGLWRGSCSRSTAPLAEIEEANERLRSVLASVSDCYFTLDRAYHISDLNEAARG